MEEVLKSQLDDRLKLHEIEREMTVNCVVNDSGKAF